MITKTPICSEVYVSVSIPNKDRLTTDQVKNRPILDENRNQIGKLIEADDLYIYGVIYKSAMLFKKRSNASFIRDSELN